MTQPVAPPTVEAPVVVVAPPIPVTLSEAAVALPSKTTAEEDLHTASQRRVNMIWEGTQRQLSLIVVIAAMLNGTWVVISNSLKLTTDMQVPTIFSLGFGMIIGFYFGRTNHQTVGGVQLGR